jgi:hypothetical protein
MNPDKPIPGDKNQGEGNRSAARRYNENLREFMNGGAVEPAARDAEAYVERKPDEAARAEREAKRGPNPSQALADEMLGKVRTMTDRVRHGVEKIIGKLRARSRM